MSAEKTALCVAEGEHPPTYEVQAATRFEIEDSRPSGNYDVNSSRQKGTSGNRCGCCCMVLVMFLIVALLLALIGFSVYLWFEISSLKSGSDSCSIQPVGVSQLNASTDSLFQMLQQEIQQQQNNLASELLNLLANNLQNQSQIEAESLGSQLNALQNQLQMSSESLRGQYSSFPLASCAALPPGSPSSFYWVSTSVGSSVYVYCDTTRSCGGVVGGWTRVVYLDMTDGNQQCPSGLRLRTNAGLRTCGIGVDAASCSQSFWRTSGLSFSRVCGRIKAYQVGSSDAFGSSGRGTNRNIDQNYVDGISLTYGSPRQHIWSFAAGLDEVSTLPQFNCPCTDSNTASQSPQPPAFVGNDYFCDTGASSRYDVSRFYNEDPLWDGAGCGPRNSCCSLNSPPWFYKQLSGATSSDIEMRVCRDEHVGNEDTAIELIEIYVQ